MKYTRPRLIKLTPSVLLNTVGACLNGNGDGNCNNGYAASNWCTLGTGAYNY